MTMLSERSRDLHDGFRKNFQDFLKIMRKYHRNSDRHY